MGVVSPPPALSQLLISIHANFGMFLKKNLKKKKLEEMKRKRGSWARKGVEKRIVI
jgi:hypothetical protein